MKNQIFKYVLTVGLICFVIFGCGQNSSTEYKSEKPNTILISKIDTLKIDRSHPPSYTNPKCYTIVFVNGHYLAKLPGGTNMINYKNGTEIFDTPEEAQECINENAKQSMQRWLDYGGY